MAGDSLHAIDTQDLIELRSLLDRAVHESRSGASSTRISAVVLLDGVVERAMLMASATLSIHPKEDPKFDDIFSRLKQELGIQWSAPGSFDVKQLHRVRNLAQHVGVTADREKIPIWAAAAQRFVRSLIRVVYNVDLFEVRLASAISNSEIQSCIAEAEELLEQGDARHAFDRAASAFDAARSNWSRGTGRNLLPSLSTPVVVRSLGDMSEPANYTRFVAENVRLISDIQFFAVDPSEYLWFEDLRKSGSQNVTNVEADRAISFVFWWIVRWESFDVAVDRDRIRAMELAKRKVRSSAKPARVCAVERLDDYIGDTYTVRLQLDDLPPDPEFYSWSAMLVKKFRMASPNGVRLMSLDHAGVLRLELRSTVTPGDVVRDLDDFLIGHESDFEDDQRDIVEARNNVDKVASQIKVHIGTRALPTWIADISLDMSISDPRGQEVPVVLKFTADVDDLALKIFDLIRSSDKGISPMHVPNGLKFYPGKLSYVNLIDAILEFDEPVSTLVDGRRQEKAARDRRRLEFDAALRAAVASGP